MLSLRKPESRDIQAFLDVQAGLGFTYDGVGATAGEPPARYVLDQTRARLGRGAAVFDSAKSALENWRQFRLDWLEVSPPEPPIRPGEVVAILAHTGGVWWLNACRIVYVVDENGPEPRFGYAYGTLPAHVGAGEERFLVEMDENGDVWYDVLAFSRPQHILARLGYPFVRILQKRFGRDSAAAMQQAVRHSGLAPQGVIR